MSFLGFFKTVFGKIESLFKEVFGSAATWEQIASTTITVVSPIVETIITLTAGEPAALAVAAIVAQIQTDMANVAKTITAAGSSPTVTTTLNSIITNLQALLTGADIKDATTLTKVESVVKTLVAEFEAILDAIPAVKV